MPQYLLSVHTSPPPPDAPPQPHMSDEEMQMHMKRIDELEQDLPWTFSARLHGADAATVVRKVNGERIVSDGPFVEAKEHLGGFYIIEADDLDRALDWAERVVDCIGMPIEVRPFADSKTA